MMQRTLLLTGLSVSLVFLLAFQPNDEKPNEARHLKNIRQLTFGGDNAEAYFSFDNKWLTYQRTYKDMDIPCDQIWIYDLTKKHEPTLSDVNGPNTNYFGSILSNGEGRTTCSFFMPGNKRVIYASTHAAFPECPMEPQRIKGKYTWAIFDTYDIYLSDLQGNILKTLIGGPGYDAEATVSPKGDKIVFTSTRNGDLDLYVCDIDGSNVKQVTNTLGYDGGAFFSPDGKQLVFRASRPKGDTEITEYKSLLAKGLVQPTNMEIFTCNIDGSNMKQVTKLGKANWAPFFDPTGKKIIFSSNHHTDEKTGPFNFQLFMINTDGTGLEQITTESNFNAFPMFSYDGKKLVFSSNRNNGGGSATNLFIADWQE